MSEGSESGRAFRDRVVAVQRVGAPAFRPHGETGFAVEHRVFDAGVVETAGVTAHTITLFSGMPFRASCVRGGRSYVAQFKRGDIEIIPKGEGGRWVDEGPGKCLIMRIESGLLNKVAASLGFDSRTLEVLSRVQVRDAQIEHLGWALEAAHADGAVPDAAFTQAIGVALATRLIKGHSAARQARVRQALTRRQAALVCDHIDAHLAERLTLSDLARVVGVSTSHFKALFRVAVGMPAHRYVIRRRVVRAVALIKEGGMPLRRIAAETGFAHPSHLARAMRAVMGQTPRELMRERR